MARVLMKGNEAIAQAAILGGADVFFGYPITPQNEIPEYLSKAMMENHRIFVQGESEIASINMIYGAAGAGARAITSSSSPGIALMQEGISYLAGSELPCVIVSVMRGGPGLGGIQPSQSDYNQATRGGGNGDYHTLVYAPATIQETVDILKEAFDVADFYRNPVMILIDGLIGQMMEVVDFEKPKKQRQLIDKKSWATIGTKYHDGRNVINSLFLDPYELETHNQKLQVKYDLITKNEVMYENINVENAEYIIVAYGTAARIAKSAMNHLNQQGHHIGMIRPITLWPFPQQAFNKLNKCKGILCVEMNLGQMVDDIKVSLHHQNIPIAFFGRTGGVIPEIEEIVDALKVLMSPKENYAK